MTLNLDSNGGSVSSIVTRFDNRNAMIPVEGPHLPPNPIYILIPFAQNGRNGNMSEH